MYVGIQINIYEDYIHKICREGLLDDYATPKWIFIMY